MRNRLVSEMKGIRTEYNVRTNRGNIQWIRKSMQLLLNSAPTIIAYTYVDVIGLDIKELHIVIKDVLKLLEEET